MRGGHSEGPPRLGQRAELYKGYGFSGRRARFYLNRVPARSARVVGVEAALQVLNKPDGGTGKAGPAVRRGFSRVEAAGGHPVGPDARNGQAAGDRPPLVTRGVDADGCRRMAMKRVDDALDRVLVQAQVRR